MNRQPQNRHAPLQIFVSYANEDEEWCDELVTHLSSLHHEGLIDIWHRGCIPAGVNQEQTIHQHLEACQIILLLLSPNFLASEACYDREMQRALERHAANNIRIIPIVVRSFDWKHTPLASLQCLPRNGKSVKGQDDRDAAWVEVIQEIHKVIEELSPPLMNTSASSFPPVWNIPYSRNRSFTGREDILERLFSQLRTGKASALSQSQAICGLGGIGKTQIAVEHAYRHRDKYQQVLWVHAESTESLTTSYSELASLLKLSLRDAQNQTVIVQAVKRWLQDHRQWLLILDNADEPALLSDFLPPNLGGHLILTTRAQAMGNLADCIQVEVLPPELGALLLLHRSKILNPRAMLVEASVTDRTAAIHISQELGGLPLALDEAGAYCEVTGESLSGYLSIFRQQRAEMLKKHWWTPLKDDQKSVATTWSLSFERVEQKDPAAADVLRLFAYLSPDAISEEIITRGAPHLGPLLSNMENNVHRLNQVIAILRSYSLINRDSNARTFSVHRLVQAVLQEAITPEERTLWRERAVHAVSATFPTVEVAHWAKCEQWLPHALLCRDWIEQEQMTFPAAVHVLTQAGLYLKERAQYTEAELFLQRAVIINRQVFGPTSPEVAAELDNLACLYWHQGKYKETEPLFKSTLEIQQRQLGDEHPATIETLENLACLYQTQGKYHEAEIIFQQALALNKKINGPEHPNVATNLSNLAELYRHLDRYEEAASLLKEALYIREKHSKFEDRNTAYIYHKQALLSIAQERYNEAEEWFVRTHKIYETCLGHEHPNTAQILHGLAEIRRVQQEYPEAEALFMETLEILKRKIGLEHPATASTINGLGLLHLERGKYLYVKQERCMKSGKYEEAEKWLKLALEIRERYLGQEHPDTALSLHNLALLFSAQERYEEAEMHFQRAQMIWQCQLRPEHPYRVHTLYHLALLYHAQQRYEEAEKLFHHVLEIRERQLGQEHPDTVLCLQNLALLSYDQKRYEKAEKLFQQILAIYEKQLGPEHPETELLLMRYISLLWIAGRDAEILLILPNEENFNDGSH